MSVLPFNKGGGAWDGQTPKNVEVIVIYAGFGDATMLKVTTTTGTTHVYLIDGGPTTMPGRSVPVYFYANLIETFLRYAFEPGGDDTFKAEGIMVTHSDADHKQGVQKLLDKFPPNKDPSPGKAKFEFDGPLLFNSDAIVRLSAIDFQNLKLSHGDTITGFEDIFTFYFPSPKAQTMLYYYSTKLPPAPPGPPGPGPSPPPIHPSSGTAIYNPDSSENNMASIILNVADPSNPMHTDVLVSLNGDSLGHLVLKALNGKNPTVFKVPHHGSRKNSIPLGTYNPDDKNNTSKYLAAHALIEYAQLPLPANPVVTYQVPYSNKYSFTRKFEQKSYGFFVKEGLKYDNMLLQLANEFKNKLITNGINVINLLAILVGRKAQIENNLEDTSIPSTQVYTNGIGALPLPAGFDYTTTKASVIADAKKRDDAIKRAIIANLGFTPPAINFPYSEADAYRMIFSFLETDRIFSEKVSLHLTTSFYKQINARTYFISSGDQHQHPNWQVVSGIIKAAQLKRTTVPTYTCRLLLTSGNGIDEENLPDNTVDDWTQYVSLQYFGGETSSVTIDPSVDPMHVLHGAVEWGKGIPLEKDKLTEQYNSTAGAAMLKTLRRSVSGRKYVVKPSGQDYWLVFVVDPVTNDPAFSLANATQTMELLNVAFNEVRRGSIIEYVFTLALKNSANQISNIYGFIGSHVHGSPTVSYKLFQKVVNAAGVEEWHYFQASGGALVKTTNRADASYFVFQDPPKAALRVRRSAPKSLITLSSAAEAKYPLEVYLNSIHYSGDYNTVSCETVLDLVVGEQTSAQLIAGDQDSDWHEFIKTILSWIVNPESHFVLLGKQVLSAFIRLIQPSGTQQFKGNTVTSTKINIYKPKTINQSIQLELNVTDSTGQASQLTYDLDELLVFESFQDYLRALGIKTDPNAYNLFDLVMFLLQSETDGFLLLSSFTRAMVNKVLTWDVDQTKSIVKFASSPAGPQVVEATLAASIPNTGNSMDLGIGNLFQIKSLYFKIPNIFQSDQQITTPHLTADVTVGDKSAKVTAVAPQGDDLPSLRVELTQSISLNDIVSFLGLNSSISNANVPLLSSHLRDIQITSAGFTIQQKVLNSNQTQLSSVFFVIQFSNLSSYLPSAFSSLENIETEVVVYQPLLSVRKIAVNATFNFTVPVVGSDGNSKNVNLTAILSAEPVQVKSQADSSYNFSVAIKISTNEIDPDKGLSLSSVLTAFGLGAAVSSAESIPFIKSLLEKVVLRELRVTLNSASKTIQSLLLKVYIPSWKMFDNKVELSELEIYLSYSDGAWVTSFGENAVFDEEYSIAIRFDLVSDVSQEATLELTNSNYEFTIQKFLSIFGLGSLGSIPVLKQVLSIAVTDAKLTLQKNDSGVTVTEGKVSLYMESINLGSLFQLSQVSVTVGFIRTEENNYFFGFSVEGFINEKVYLSVAYDPNTQVLSGRALIASFETANLSDAVGAILQNNSQSLSNNSVYSSVSNSFIAAISVEFNWNSGDFSLKSLVVDLKNLFSIGSINLEQLQFEYSKTDTSSPTDDTSLLPAGSQIKLIGVLKGTSDSTFSAIVEFDLNKDTSGASTIMASIRPAEKNTLTLLSFLSLFGITTPAIPAIEGQNMPNFFDLALTEGSIELSLPDYSVNSVRVKANTPNSVILLNSPQITLENLSFEVNYSKSDSPTTTGTLLGAITLAGIKIAVQGTKQTNGTVFKAVVGPESANLREYIQTLTPADTTSPAIPSDVGLPQPIPVYLSEMVIGLLTDKNTVMFKGTSQLQWNIDLGFTHFQILELGGLINYVKMKTEDMSSKFSVYVTGKFQFSSNVLMEAELHFGTNADTTLAVLVTDASQVQVNSVADNLLKFNQSKTPADTSSPSPPSTDTPSGTIAFQDLLPSSTVSLVNLTSAYINLNLTQSVFLLVGQVASLGSGFFVAGKFSPQQTSYGYAFGISLPQGFRFSQLNSALALIDDIVVVTKANCVVMSMENAKVNDVVEKMNAAKNSVILPENAGGLVFPFSNLQLDEATKNLTITKGMSFYAEFNIPALSSDSIFHSIIQISSSPDISALIISAIIASDPTKSEFRAHMAQLTLLGLLEFSDVTLIYRPSNSVTLELNGAIAIRLGDTSYNFYGSFTNTKTDAVFSITSDPSKQVTIHEPLGMFGISLENARLTLRYNFPEDGEKSSSMEIAASVNFYSTDSSSGGQGDHDTQTPQPVVTLDGLIVFRNYSPVVVSVTISPTKRLTIADFVATIFHWQYNLDFLNIGFVDGRIYYAKLSEEENTITIGDVEYNSGYHISADTEIFDIVFTIEANIPLDKSQVSITGYAHQPIDLGFAKFTGKKTSDPSQPDETKSPQLTFTTSSSSTSISIGIGLILFEVPLATADIGYNLTKKVFTGTLTYSGSIGSIIQNPSISFEWSSEFGFKVTSFPMSGPFDFDLLDKLKNYKDSCGQLVDLAFKQAVQTKFNINTNIAKTTQPEQFLAEIQITGTYDVLLAGQAKIASVPIPDLSVGIPHEDNFSLSSLPQFILDLFTQNADRIVQQIVDDPERLGKIIGIAVLKTVSEKVIQTLVCRNVDSEDLNPEDTGEDPTEDDFDEADEFEEDFDDFADDFGDLAELGELGEAGAAAAGAEQAAQHAGEILAGIIGAIGAILAFFNIGNYREKKEKAENKKKAIEEKNQQIRERMNGLLDIKQAPTTKFSPPNQLNVSWNPLAASEASYHLVVTGTLLSPTGGEASGTVKIYESVISDNQKVVTSDQFYNAVGINVTVNATLTATKDGYSTTFNGQSYTTPVSNVHPTLHAPAQVSATYEHDTLKITATASSVEHAKGYHFELVEGTDAPYTVISQSTYTGSSKATNVSVTFDHSSISSTASGPFKVRCQAVAESGSNIATSDNTYSASLSFISAPRELTVVLSHFGEPNQDITLNWRLPQSTNQDSINGFFCRIVHKASNTVLVSNDVEKPASQEGQPPLDIPTTHSFTIDSVVQALTSNNLVPDPPASIEMEAQVSTIGTSNTVIDSHFTETTLTSLIPPEQVTFNFSADSNALTIAWKYTQQTGIYGIEITDEQPQVLFSKSVRVNKKDSHPQDTSEPDSGDHKVNTKIPYSELSSINDPTVDYTVQLSAVTTGNEKLDSLFPTIVTTSLHVLPTPREVSLQFKPQTGNVDVQFNSVPNASGYLFQLTSDSTVLASVVIPKPTTESDPPSDSVVINGSLSINTFIDQLSGGDQVRGIVQALGGGNFLNSSSLTFSQVLTVQQPPSNVTYSFSPKKETITISCSRVDVVSEYLLGLSNDTTNDVASLKSTPAGNQVSVTLSISIVQQLTVEEWKVFAQSLGDATHLSSPHSFLTNTVHVLPKPDVQQLMFDDNFDVLTVVWPPISDSASYSLTVTAMKDDLKLFTTTKEIPANIDDHPENVVATISMATNDSDWGSTLDELTSLTGKVIAVGANYYISSAPGPLPTITRFDPPQNLQYGYDSSSDLVTLTVNAVMEVSQYTLGLTSATNPDLSLSQTVTQNENEALVSLSGSDVRNANDKEWEIFGVSAGDSTHFPSVKVTLGSTVKVIDPPVFNTFTIDSSNQILSLAWSSIQEASEYNISVEYQHGAGAETSTFDMTSSPSQLSLQINMNEQVRNWDTIFKTTTSIMAKIKAVGSGYFITSMEQSSPSLTRLSSPQNLSITSDSTNITITWSSVSGATAYNVVYIFNGVESQKKVTKNTLVLVIQDLTQGAHDPVFAIQVKVSAISDGTSLPSDTVSGEHEIDNRGAIFQSQQFGGNGGQVFSDPIYDHTPKIIRIKAIKIRHQEAIESIQVSYLLADGYIYVAPKHGGNNGTESNFEFDLGEEIIKVYGQTSNSIINQMTFVTKSANGIERKYGPFGQSQAHPIHFEVAGKVLGIFGRAGTVLDAIGFYMISLTIDAKSSPIYGGGGGGFFNDPNSTQSQIVGIRAIRIRHGNQVDSIQATYILEDGSTWVAPKHGGWGGSESYIKFAAGEYITRVDGKTNWRLADQFTFTTEKPDGTTQTYGPYGRTGQSPFSVDGRVISFHGRSGNLLDAIGFNYVELPTKAISTSQRFGGNGGGAFSDNIPTHKPEIIGIKAIRIRHGDQVDSIQATYRQADGSTWVAPKHGGYGGRESFIEFADNENVTRIEGKTNNVLVDQITFVTRKSDGSTGRYGPFGITGQTPFAVDGKILGFFGRSGTKLDSIGVYYIP